MYTMRRNVPEAVGRSILFWCPMRTYPHVVVPGVKVVIVLYFQPYLGRTVKLFSGHVVVVQCGWLLTIAGLGDSRAVLDTGANIVQLSVDHRVATHRQERHRLEGTGALVAPIDVSGANPHLQSIRDTDPPTGLFRFQLGCSSFGRIFL